MTFGRTVALAFVLVGCAPVTQDNSGHAPPHQTPGAGTGGNGSGKGGAGGGGAGAGGSGGTNNPPKQPPTGTGGGPTADACNGVTAKGRCELSDKGQIAVVCDVAANKLQTFDCTAMMKVCVLDAQRGATCETLPPPNNPKPSPPDMARNPPPHATDMSPPHAMDMSRPNPPPHPADMATPACASGVDYRGYCAATTAIWCDPATGQTIVVNCATRGQTCQTDTCADGAYCCDAPAPVDMAQPASSECSTLGFSGVCSANHARWCDGTQIVDVDCTAQGELCQVDKCASGAYCCASMSTPPPDLAMDPASECATLGLAGVCDGQVARYCSGGQIVTHDCTAAGLTCQIDVCATGADCCTPPAASRVRNAKKRDAR